MKKQLLSLLLLTTPTAFGMHNKTFNLAQACEYECQCILQSSTEQQQQHINELIALKNCRYTLQSLQDTVVQKNIYLLARNYLLARCIPITLSVRDKKSLTACDIINHEQHDIWKICWHGALISVASEILDVLAMHNLNINLQSTKLEDRMDEIKDSF